jgi:hypothetical protein
MFWSDRGHRRCESIETLLRTRIQDLETQLDTMNEERRQDHERHSVRERELLDRLLAVTNPGAAATIAAIARSVAPAPPRPVAVARPTARVPGAHARLRPDLAGFEPSAEARAAGVGDRVPVPIDESAAEDR